LRSQDRRFRTEWIAFGALLLFSIALVATVLYRGRMTVEAIEGDRLQVQARVIDENLIRQLEGASNALTGIAGELRGQDIAFDAAQLNAELKLITDAMPGISSMLVLDAHGTIAASSREALVGKNFAQREYFDVPRRGGDPARLYVSPPFNSTLNTYVVVLSRVLTHKDGRFAGVVTATLDPDYFTVVLRSVLYAPDMRTTLIHREGKIFLNMPVVASALGMDLSSPSSMFSQHLRSGQLATLANGTAAPTGDERMVALRSIDRPDLRLEKPLVVSVSRESRAVLAPWRERAWESGMALAAGALAGALTLWLNQRRRRSWRAIEDAVAKERQAGAERIELALRGADLGLWDLHVPTDRFIINQRERTILGYDESDALPQGIAWRALIHVDDRERVKASMASTLRGDTSNFSCEHRMRHKAGHDVWLSSHAMIVERDAQGAPVRIVGTHLDITERRRADERLALANALLRDSEEEMRLVTDNMPALVSRLDVDQRFCFANRAYADWLQLDTDALIGRSLAEVYGADVHAQIRPHVEAALAGQRVTYERELHTAGGPRQVQFTLVPQVGRDGAVKGFYALATDVNDHRIAEERLRRLAEYDSLTGLPNRALFHERLRQAMARTTVARPMALLFIDIDRFKSINDTLGHEAGDQLLQAFAARMRGATRATDTVARLAGDEFTIVLEPLRDGEEAKTLAQSLIVALRAPVVLAGETHEVTISLGMVFCTPGESDPAALLRRADVALYKAKQRGRNRFVVDEAPRREDLPALAASPH
jgi:diguanylate cyclase (GGDEF)-like protein/PAS domain S-box-containing protein